MALSGLVPYLITPVLAILCLMIGWLIAGKAPKPHFSIFERAWFYLFLGLVAFSWIGTILSALGEFKVIPIILAFAILVGFSRRPRPKSTARDSLSDHSVERTPWPILVLLIFFSLGIIWLYAKPTESFLLTDDSAVYTIGGISLARSGSLWVTPSLDWSGWVPGGAHIGVWEPIEVSFDVLLNIPQGFLRQFFTEGIVFARHFGPFYQWSLTNPTLEIGFLALPKVWTALVTLIFGAEYASYAAPFMGFVGLWATYMLIRKTLGWPSACVGILVLAVSLPQLWFARLSLSEIYTQVLFLGGIYLLMLVRANLAQLSLAKHLAALSAISLAAITIVRFEALLMILPLVVVLLLNPNRLGWERKGVYRYWLWILLGACLFGTILSAATAPYYFFTRLTAALSPVLIRRLLLILVGIICVAVAAFGSRSKIKGYWITTLQFARQHVYHLILGLWLGWIVFAAFQLRSPLGSSLAGWLGQYLTWQGLIAALLGCVGMIYILSTRRLHYELIAFLGIAILFMWLYSFNPRVTTLHPWAMRRLIPVVIPALAIGVSAIPWCVDQLLATAWNLSKGLKSIVTLMIALAVTLLVGWKMAQVSRPFVMFQDKAGTFDELAELAAKLPAKSLLLYDDNEASQRLTPVMELVFNRPSLVVYNVTASNSLPLVDSTVKNALKAGYRVYYVETGTNPIPWDAASWQVVPTFSQSLATNTVRQVWGRPPTGQDIALNIIMFEVYEIFPKGTGLPDISQVIPVPVMEGRYSYYYSGFNQLESDSQGHLFRWTDGFGQLRVPWPGEDNEPLTVCLELQVSGGRPNGLAPTELRVLVEDEPFLVQAMPTDFTIQDLKIPINKLENSGDSSLEISLQSSTFEVTETGNPPITRTLGVMFYGATLEPNGTCR